MGGLCEQKMTAPGFVMPKNKFIQGINSHCISRISDCGPQVWSLSIFVGFLFSKGSNQSRAPASGGQYYILHWPPGGALLNKFPTFIFNQSQFTIASKETEEAKFRDIEAIA